MQPRGDFLSMNAGATDYNHGRQGIASMINQRSNCSSLEGDEHNTTGNINSDVPIINKYEHMDPMNQD